MRPYGWRLGAKDFAANDRTLVPVKLSRTRELREANRLLVHDLEAEADAGWLLDYTARCGDPSCGEKCAYYDDPWFVSDAIGILSYLRRSPQPLTFRLQLAVA